MRLGVNLGYWSTAADARDGVRLAQEADQLGYAVAWAAEAYGSDVVTVLTWVAAQTESINVGSGIMQIPGRTPAMTAMTAASLDALSGGRFRLGLGVSGPQVSEGWHGVRYDKPLTRTREYVDVVRRALTRERLTAPGPFYPLPLPDGPGKALKLIVHPLRDRIPIYIAAVGPKNLELTGEIADGWLAVFFSPTHASEHLARLEAGRRQAGLTLDGFDIVPTVPLSLGPDVRACADPIRPYAALYVGGMGSREQNFYNRLARSYGYEAAAQECQDRYLAHDYAGAMAAVPFEFLDETSLLGPKERVAERLAEFAAAGVTTLTLTPVGATVEERAAGLRTAVEALDLAGVGS
jgi:F420-dependent oxidoreductase-like protein